MRHGLRSGKFMKDQKYIENRVNQLRRDLEDAVMACRGEVGIEDAAFINTAIRWESVASKCQHHLRKSRLTVELELKFMERMATASANRDRAIQALELDMESDAPDLQKYIEATVVSVTNEA